MARMLPHDRTARAALAAWTASIFVPAAVASTALPGILEAEDYDSLGAGISYSDSTAGNMGGEYRVDDVDIESSAPGEYHVGFTTDEEWLAYTVTAPSDLLCTLRYRSAASGGGPYTVRLAIDGLTHNVVNLDQTGGSTSWADHSTTHPFAIAAGTHTVQVTFVNGGLNLDEIEFVEVTQPLPAYQDPTQPVSNRVSDLLSRMTLDDKLGQMCLVDRRFFADFPQTANLEADIRDLGIGGIFSGGGSAPTPNTKVAWADMTDRFQAYALDTDLAIPMLYGSDAVHGHNNLIGATIFPHNIGLGAAADTGLVTRISQAAAVEIAATGVRWTFAPAVSVPRHLAWGRTYEGFSETPDLVSELGAAAIRGYQGENLSASTSILACAKHYAGDGGTDGGVDQGNVILADTNEFFDLFLTPYEAAVSNGCLSVMASYNAWNGDLMHAHTNLLTDVLKGDFGFEGFILSDWAGVDRIYPGSSGNYYYSIIAGVNAGLDLIMVPDRYPLFLSLISPAVSAGSIPMSRIDDAVGRILSVKFKLGLFEQPWAARELLDRVGSVEHREIAREAVRRSVVLLKNDDDLLPLAKDLGHVHVAGRHADNLGYQCGGWTIEWQGGSGDTTVGTTIFDGITNAVSPSTLVTYSIDGTGAAGADVAVVVVGETPYAEGQGDNNNPALAGIDRTAIQNAQAAGVPVVVVLVSGRPLVIDTDLPSWDACLAAWLPGTEGNGVADVLFADHYPSAQLSQTWPVNSGQEPINEGDVPYAPLFPFGGGTSYSPSLAASQNSPEFEFRWTSAADSFVLQEAGSLGASANWTNTPGSAMIDGTDLVITNSPAADTRFYRLDWQP